jgi:leucyl/phenylalanyl-tRNA--protein transferase
MGGLRGRGGADPRPAAADHVSLAPESLLTGYVNGWFPMDEPGATGPVGMFESDPRGVMPIEGFSVPRSVRRALRVPYEVRLDTAFSEVARLCAEREEDGVWLTPRLVRAYERLHLLGHAHSVETWRDGRLCGGLFGVALGAMFTSETMFHRAPDAGNAALVATAGILARAGFTLWDVQVTSEHTVRFGAEEIAPAEYRRRLRRALRAAARPFVV